ncbi:probable serine/threonine-protein kinase At1g54610 isoform X2 [Helianthus annuus]|uniref:probable serine/threonine-protein kinase At1g54610 isoform X2 n=1 Tax=Helianthus annuus TaxID=4232 RepID=UPI000B8F7F42|nr:probable serine/threonine-protein kinase At1g54610 isoform X2 [Helianthus annuus]
MGCVLCKRATPDHPSNSHNGQHQSSLTHNVEHLVSVTAVDRIRHSIAEAPPPDRRRPKPAYSLKTSQGWPEWLCDVAGDVIKDWTPRRANTFEKIDKIGQGTYSNVYKARDLITGKIVALKKVRFDNLEPESVKFMAREILILKKLNHPNIIKLQGLVTSRMSSSLYLVFEYMEHDLSGLQAVQGVKFTEPQVKCYIKQLLSGLEHCHENGVLHRDIKGSNLLIDNDGILKIADFGLASFYNPQHKQPMTSRVVTLWYRPPELLLGATYYGVGVDLWSAGCILAELLAGKPILPGRTEFFTTEPYACEPSELPKYPPSKEIDVKLREEEARRQRRLSGKSHAADGNRRTRPRERVSRAVPAPEANAEIQSNLDRRRAVTEATAKSKSEKFPPPHQDAALGYPTYNGRPTSFATNDDNSFGSSIFESKSSRSVKEPGTMGGSSRRKKGKKELSRKFIRSILPTSVSLSMDFGFRSKEPVSEVYGSERL